jgi:uracil-DNA glycosylase
MWFEAMHPSWQLALADQRTVLQKLESSLASATDRTPAADLVMRAFELPIEKVRVLLIGQDPYPEAGVACGLAFAVNKGSAKLPASLRNIMTELNSDLPEIQTSGNLEQWAEQGVLLLNRHLTTRVGQAGAHEKQGWTDFTDAVVQALAANRKGHLVAILWGAHAGQVRGQMGEIPVISGVHPSPLSAYRGFFGSKPFSACNLLLAEMGEPPIDWNC